MSEELRKMRADRLGLEPAAVDPKMEDITPMRHQPMGVFEVEIEHSKAISLKRIADMLEPLVDQVEDVVIAGKAAK